VVAAVLSQTAAMKQRACFVPARNNSSQDDLFVPKTLPLEVLRWLLFTLLLKSLVIGLVACHFFCFFLELQTLAGPFKEGTPDP